MELINAKIVEKIQWVEEGNCYGYSVVGTVAVEDLGENKKISVHYTYDDEHWNIAEGQYVRKASSGKEIWRFETVINLPNRKNEDFYCRLAIKLQVEGKEYWDNNNGKDYSLWRKHECTVNYNPRYVLGNVNVSLVNYGRACDYNKLNKDYITGNILLRSFDYNKEVRIRYTSDNWITFKEKRACYEGNNSNNTEIWTFSLDDIPQGSKVHFCISYTVAGETYWDNNFGDNYVV